MSFTHRVPTASLSPQLPGSAVHHLEQLQDFSLVNINLAQNACLVDKSAIQSLLSSGKGKVPGTQVISNIVKHRVKFAIEVTD